MERHLPQVKLVGFSCIARQAQIIKATECFLLKDYKSMNVVL